MNHNRRHGSTLIEVAIGSMMMAVLLIPAMRLMSESDSLGRRHETHLDILFWAEECLEQAKIAMSDPIQFDYAWSASSGTDQTTKIAIDGGADLLCRTRILADKSVGTSPGRLVTISVEVWNDTNGTSRFESGEPNESLHTQWASP